jgi:Glycosyl transferase family 90
MFKSLRLKLREVTFYLESIFQTKKLTRNPRAINLARVCKLNKIGLAEDIFGEKFKPLKVKLNLKKDNQNIDIVRWHALSPDTLQFDINIQASNEELEPTFKRLFDLLPLIGGLHTSNPFQEGSINLNLGDFAKTDGLAFCSNRINQLLIPDIDFISTHGYDEMRKYFQESSTFWNQKKEILFWRGSSTGISNTGSWRDLQRVRLCEIAMKSKDEFSFDVGLSNIVQLDKSAEKEIKQAGYLKGYQSIKTINTFKYLIDVDGNSNAWSSFFLKLLSGSAVLKVESLGGFKQWYYDRLTPWEHYVPINADLSDLEDKLNWLQDNDEIARRIANAGQDFALNIRFEKELLDTLNLIKKNFKPVQTTY